MTFTTMTLEVWGRNRETAQKRAGRIAKGFFKVLQKHDLPCSGEYDYYDVEYQECVVPNRKRGTGLYRFRLTFHR